MLSGVSPKPSAVRSPEDQDLLERSTKKTKTGNHEPSEGVTNGDQVMENGETVSPPVTSPTANIFYKAVAANETVGLEPTEKDLELISDDEVDGEDEVDDPIYPKITLTKEEKFHMRIKWRLTLIVKVFGRSVGYTYLLKRLMAMWKPKAIMELVITANGYFLVKFGSEDDYDFAKYEGPWMVLDHYLIVKEWRPNFDPWTNTTENILAWIRMPCLPAEYYDHNFLMKVGRKVGRPIMIDTAKNLASRASFARICVEVDITKPLLSKFKVGKRVRTVTYEGIHLICFKCGMYGHNHEKCEKKSPNENMAAQPADQTERSLGTPATGDANGQSATLNGSRYGALAETVEENTEIPEEVEEEQNGLVTTNKTRHAKYRLDKGKRPAVQVSEKQIQGNNTHGLHSKQAMQDGTSTRKENTQRKKGKETNQAAAESEHTMVRGDKEGGKTTETISLATEDDNINIHLVKTIDPEHSSDPPDGNLQSNGNMVVDVEACADGIELLDEGEMEMEL
ncbi:PREDICTED: uncharacterized protein LOC109174421 [Ipomoea nil]|uniref:uncharacterized protein LOC109174421 n=1 Tax=Ipomoea nil TaxID=35883 RepID=UPI000901BECE|nr:PREDICTED: uncharacterized protein LOC109174421 [Ipomoea nil]